MRIAALCAVLGLFWLTLPAHAEGLYRCTGSSGEPVFTNRPAGYQGCHRMNVQAQAPINSDAPVSKARAKPKSAGKAVVLQQATTTSSTDAADSDELATVEDLDASPSPRRNSGKVLSGAVYRVVHADGSVEYTNVPPRGGKGRKVTRLFTYIDTCVACNVHSTIDWMHVPLNLTAYAGDIQKAATEFGVSQGFLRAIIHAESAFNVNALSNKGAQGLMQLMPGTASDMGVLDAFDAAQNIRGGARYLALLLKDFKGDASLAAAAYNAGPGAVQKYSGIPPYEETEVYVQRVDTLRKRYEAALARPPLASR